MAEGKRDVSPCPVTQRKQMFGLSPEELAALNECRRESFLYRCFPISTIAMFATHFAVHRGYLKPNPRWGSLFKCMGAGFVGYIVGKISYHKQCEEKILRIPNSKLADIIRKKKGMFRPDSDQAQYSYLPAYAGIPQDETRTRKSSLDLDFERADVQGLDDAFRPSLDSPEQAKEAEPQSKEQSYTSYDELQKKNREDYQRRMSPPTAPQQTYQPSPQPSYVPADRKPISEQQRQLGAKNKYGDEWES